MNELLNSTKEQLQQISNWWLQELLKVLNDAKVIEELVETGDKNKKGAKDAKKKGGKDDVAAY